MKRVETKYAPRTFDSLSVKLNGFCMPLQERIRPRPSLAPLAYQDELVQQSRREQQLGAY